MKDQGESVVPNDDGGDICGKAGCLVNRGALKIVIMRIVESGLEDEVM